ncbi:MAG: LamG domain-containing protein, partial [Armatimonadota bacterium]|nr:LamG domain-containing protein [Armatimonadota bacterium]
FMLSRYVTRTLVLLLPVLSLVQQGMAQEDPVDEFEINQNMDERRLDGKIRSINLDQGSFILDATQLSWPNGRLNTLTVPQTQKITGDALTLLHLRGNLRQRVALTDLRPGDNAVVIARFSESRKAWQARRIAVWTRRENGRYVLEGRSIAGVPEPLLPPQAPPPPCVPPPAGLVAWWPGNNSGEDATGNNSGVQQNGTDYVPGVVGPAFGFDGVDDRFSIRDSAAFKLTSLTIEGWIFVASLRGPGHILLRGDNRSGRDPYALTVHPDQAVQFHIGSARDEINLDAPIRLRRWQHVAATFDDATGAMRIYVNGILAAQTKTSMRPLRDLDAGSGAGIGIGNHPSIGSTPHNIPFHGIIDELSLYSRALTLEEIQAIAKAGTGGKCSPHRTDPAVTAREGCAPAPQGLVGWWRGDGNTNDVLSDNSANLHGGAALADGKVGQAFHFDGQDDFAQVARISGLTPGNPPHTVETWIKVAALPKGRAWLLLLGKGGVGSLAEHWILTPTGALHIGAWNGGSVSVASIAPGVWRHVASVFDGRTLQVYVDGVPVGSTAATFNLQGISLAIAKRQVGLQDEEDFNGAVDELSIYNRALTADEIQAIYRASGAGKCPPTRPVAAAPTATETGKCLPPPPSLISWWPGEGDARDVVGPNSGKLVEATTFAAGKVGQAFQFDGERDYVSVPFHSSHDFAPGSQFTLEAWVKPQPRNQFQAIITKSPLSGEWNWGLYLDPADRFTTGRAGAHVTGTTVALVNTWYHVAATYNAGNWELFVNGVLEGEATGIQITQSQ